MPACGVDLGFAAMVRSLSRGGGWPTINQHWGERTACGGAVLLQQKGSSSFLKKRTKKLFSFSKSLLVLFFRKEHLT
jgi:hypothetical protein